MKTVESSEQAPRVVRQEEFNNKADILQTRPTQPPAARDGGVVVGDTDKHKEYYAHQSERTQRDYVDMDLRQAESQTETEGGGGGVGGENTAAAVSVVHGKEEGNQTMSAVADVGGPVCVDTKLNEDDDDDDEDDDDAEASSPPVLAEERIKAKCDAGEEQDLTKVVIKDTDAAKQELHTDDGVYLSREGECDDLEEIDGDDDDDDDDDSLVLSDQTTCAPCVMITEDESHYITTHEIQLCELSDHEGGGGGGADSDTAGEEGVDGDGEESWDIEDNDNVVYSFVDYRAPTVDAERVKGKQQQQQATRGDTVSTLSESDPRDSGSETRNRHAATGQIHLSIKATSRAINDTSSSSNIQNKGNNTHRAGGGGGALFIAPPRRLHFARNLKGKDISNEYSTTSGASSAVSELDEADREVRSLTAKAFRSLAACGNLVPYRKLTSSESSCSVQSDGLSRWSAFVDLQYGNMSQHHRGLEHHHHHHHHHQSMQVSHNNRNKASFEIAQKNLENNTNNNNKGCYKGVALASIKEPPGPACSTKILDHVVGNPAAASSSSSSSSKQIELTGKFTRAGHAGVITLTETLNFRCNVNSTGAVAAAEERRAKFAQQNNAGGAGGGGGGSRSSTDEVTNTLPAAAGPRGGGGGGGGQANDMQQAATPRSHNALLGSEPAMEDTTHKKAVFASSVIKNVLSKKMQFEQERKMERGEIREPTHTQQQRAACSPSSCSVFGAGGGGDSGDMITHSRDNKDKVSSSGMRRRGSKHSEGDSDANTIVCVDELGDIVDSGSCKSNRSERQQDTALPLPLSLAAAAAPETNLESNEAGMDSKKGASDAAAAAASAKSSTSTTTTNTLLRSQNSAFRSWRDEEEDDDDTAELELPQDHKINDHKSPQGRIPPPPPPHHDDTDIPPPPPPRPVTDDSGKLTKMSRLFVPTIQVLSDGGEVGHHQQQQQLPNNMNYRNYSTRAYQAGEGGGGGGGVKNSLYVAAADSSRSVVTSKSPEIKINLRSVRDAPFTVSKLRASAPCSAPCAGGRTDGDFRCQALAAALIKGELSVAADGKNIPHFTVRDIRDNSGGGGGGKGKLQTPIHQVRDVRKLVKSSYHFVSLDNNNSSSSTATAAVDLKQQLQAPNNRNLASVSPIVIKCQSVNTNSNGKQQGPPAAAADCSGGAVEVQQASKRRPAAHEETFDPDRSSSPEGAIKSVSAPPRRPSLGNAATAGVDSAEGLVTADPKGEAKAAAKRQEKLAGAADGKKSDSKVATSALEKLQAAVKTMEQLYVFDRNEWKRKSEPRHLLADSPVQDDGAAAAPAAPSNLDMLGRRDSCPGPGGRGRTPPAMSAEPKREAREPPRSFQSPVGARSLSSQSAAVSYSAAAAASKNAFSLTASSKASSPPSSNATGAKALQPRAGAQSPRRRGLYIGGGGGKPCCSAPNSSPKLPVSLKITQAARHRAEAACRETESSSSRPFSASADSENYLAIPVKPRAAAAGGGNNSNSSSGGGGRQSASAWAAAAQEKTAIYTFTSGMATKATSPPGAPPGWPAGGAGGYESRQSPLQQQQQQQQQRSSIVLESRSSQDTPTATIYHHPVLNPLLSQPQVYCFSPAAMTPPAPCTPAALDPFQPTQRKMLLDPTTGNFYLVDTPVQHQATRRLFDPETGQYVDVPMPPQQLQPMPPMPPMPMSPMPMSPLAMSPTAAYTGAYGHTYMIYPGGFSVPAPMIQSRASLSQSQMSPPSDAESGEKTTTAAGSSGGGVGTGGGGPAEGVYMESPFYLATGKSPHMMMSPYYAPQAQHMVDKGANTRTPQGVISITSNQQQGGGPRIIAPPSFDGTTMSFVVEHR